MPSRSDNLFIFTWTGFLMHSSSLLGDSQGPNTWSFGACLNAVRMQEDNHPYFTKGPLFPVPSLSTVTVFEKDPMNIDNFEEQKFLKMMEFYGHTCSKNRRWNTKKTCWCEITWNSWWFNISFTSCAIGVHPTWNQEHDTFCPFSTNRQAEHLGTFGSAQSLLRGDSANG